MTFDGHRAISTSLAPKAIGPYNQAILANGLVFTSGQIALDAATGEIVSDEVAEQTTRVLQNLGAILKASGADFDTVVKCTVYLADMNDFAVVNEVYASFFPGPAPARSTVEVARLPKDVRVEIDCIALVRR